MIGKIWKEFPEWKKRAKQGALGRICESGIFRDPGNRMDAPLGSEVCSWGPSSEYDSCFTMLLCYLSLPFGNGCDGFYVWGSHEALNELIYMKKVL